MPHSNGHQTALIFVSSLAVSAGGFLVLSSLPSMAAAFNPVQGLVGAAALFLGLAVLVKGH